MLTSFAVYKVVPFFWIGGNNKEGVKLSEFCVVVRNGLYFAIVLFFESLHLCVHFWLLVYPETAELFKEAYLVFFLKALYVRLVNVHPLQDFDCFLFLGDSCFHSFSSLDIIFEFLEVATDVFERFFKSEPRQKILIVCILRQGIFLIPFIAEQVGWSIKSRSEHCVVQKCVNFVFILLVEARRVGVIDKFSDNT